MFALTMANSLATYNKMKNEGVEIKGTSPEENEILRYWIETKKEFHLIQNPLEGETGDLIFKIKGSQIARRVEIIERNRYQFRNSKTSQIRLLSNSKQGCSCNVFVR